MLVLSRRQGQHVIIKVPENAVAGTLIKVHLVRISTANVRLGFEAPTEYVIVREEIEINEKTASN